MLLAALLCAAALPAQTTLPLQGAVGVRTGVTFSWADTQTANSDAATLQGISIDGKAFNKFAVPTGYTLNQPGMFPGDNNLLQNGVTVYNLELDGLAGWDAAALTAYQSLNLNYYFTSNSNGEETCGNYAAIATTTAVQHSLTYDPPLPVNAGGFAAVTERNANNCFHLAVFGRPPGAAETSPEVLLGETFVRPWTTQFGPQVPAVPPTTGVDYWLTERVNDTGGTIGIAIFKLDELAPIGSRIMRVRLTASTTDPGDGKFLVMQSYAVADEATMFIEDPPLVGNVATNDQTPVGSTYSVVTPPANGELVLDPDGRFVYTPTSTFVGIDTFRYRVCLPAPNESVCDEAQVTISVRPRARNDSASGVAGQAILVSVLANDPPFLGLSGVKLLNNNNQEVTSRIVGGEGTWTISNGTQLLFSPSNGFSGTSTPVRYVAYHSASGLRTNEASVTVTYTDKAAVGDRVWLDLNANGRQDAGETGRNGVTVRLLNSQGTTIATTTTTNHPVTSEPGFYQFTGLNQGFYFVRFTAPSGFVFSPQSGTVGTTNNSDANTSTGTTSTFFVGNGTDNRFVDAGLVRVVQNGSLQLLKSAEWHVPEQNIARVRLEIAATMPLITRDVVLVLDVSGSMDTEVSGTKKSRLTLMKEAASDFATQFLDAKFQGRHRLALVAFANAATVQLGLSSDLQSVLNSINGIVTLGGTNTQAGIQLATDLLDTAPDLPNGLGPAQEKFMLVCADGQANAAHNVLSTASVIQEDRDAFYFPATYPDGSAIAIKGTSFGTTIQRPNSTESSWRAVSQALISKRKGYRTYGIAFGRESEIGTLATWTMRHVSSSADQYFNTVDNPGNIFNTILEEILTAGKNAVVHDVMGFGDGYDWQLLTGQPAYPITTSPAVSVTTGTQTQSGVSLGVVNWTPGLLKGGSYTLTYFARLRTTKLLPAQGTNSVPLPTSFRGRLNYDRLDGVAQAVDFPSPALTVPLRSLNMLKTNDLGEALTGAGFTLYSDQAGTTLVAPEQLMNNLTGAVLFPGMVRGTTYFMRETRVPAGMLDEQLPYRVVVTDQASPAISVLNPFTQQFEPLTADGLGRWQVINRRPATAVADASLDNQPNQTVVIDVLANDIAGGYPIDPTTVVLVNPPAGATVSPDGRSLVVAGQATWTVNPVTGEVSVTPEAGFWGEASLVSYRMRDIRGFLSNTATIQVSFKPFLGIGNVVFIDRNDNITHDPGEGVSGVPVQLYRASQTPGVDLPLAVTTTATNGTYFFDELEPGIYVLHIPAVAFRAGGALANVSVIPQRISGDDDVGHRALDLGLPSINGVSSDLVGLFIGSAPTSATGETGFLAASDDDRDSAVDLTIDFGLHFPLSLGNLVFMDANANGRADPGEGFPGVTVELYLASQAPGQDLPIASQVTDAQGGYHFTDLLPGTYRVHVPAAMFDPGQPLWQLRSLPGTNTNTDDNAGEDGIDDWLPERNGISSAVVQLSRDAQPLNSTTETGLLNTLDDFNDANGNLTVDFGFAPLDPTQVAVGNLVFIDRNGNNTADPGEGVAGVLVHLHPAGADPAVDPPLAATITSSGGAFLFGGLEQGSYFLHIPPSQFELAAPLHHHLSLPGAGGDDGLDDLFDENGLDTDQPAVTGISTAAFALAPGSEPTNGSGEFGHDFDVDDTADANTDLTIDLGFYLPMALGNLVFFDANANGRADSGEGVAGVTVQLFPSWADPQFDSPIASTVTDASGRYHFTRVREGDYFVQIPPSAFAPGAPLHEAISLPGQQPAPDNDDDDDGPQSQISGDDDTGEDGIDEASPATLGVRSRQVTLAPGTAPTAATGETGFDSTSDDTDLVLDALSDLTVDFGFTRPATLSLRVFHDADTDGRHTPLGADAQPGTPDDEPLLPNVPVEVWSPGADGSAGTQDDLLTSSSTTDAQGLAVFAPLPAGRYFIRIPESSFAPGGPLEALPFATPVHSYQDDGVSGDSNGRQPLGRATAVLSPVVFLQPGETDDTLAFGFLNSPVSLSWASWQARHASLPNVTPSGNSDGDAFSNLAEFAFALDPQSASLPQQPFRLESNASGQVDLVLRRVTSISGLSYTLEALADLATSPSGWTSPAAPAPTVTFDTSGTEEARYASFSTLPLFASGQGFVRLRIDLDTDFNGTPEATFRSEVLGWSRLSLGAHLQTLGQSYAPQSPLTSIIGSLQNGTSIPLASALGDSPLSALLPSSTAPAYLEILSGPHAGHRLELDVPASLASASTQPSLVLLPNSPRTTLRPLPSTLVGAQFALRSHVLLNAFAPPARFRATNNPATADRILFYDNPSSAFRTYWLFANAGSPRWVLQGDSTFSDRGSFVVEPGSGAFIHPRSFTVSLSSLGQVRSTPFALPLPRGISLVTSAWPLNATPANAALFASSGFTGASSTSSSDQIQRWLGDASPGAQGYQGFFYLRVQSFNQWVRVGDGTLASQNQTSLLPAHRASLFLARNPIPNWILPLPWNP